MFITFIAVTVFLFASKSLYEGDDHDLSKVVITEIWVDLKEKRFLNSGNGFSDGSGPDPGKSLHPKRRFFLFWA